MHFFRTLNRRFIQALCTLLVLAFLPTSTLQAAMVGTESIIQSEQLQLDRDQILHQLQQEEAQQALEKLGVSTSDLQERVENMSPQELAQFNAELEELPAGGIGIFGAIVFVLLLLIVLDLLGTADIFPAIKPIKY